MEKNKRNPPGKRKRLSKIEAEAVQLYVALDIDIPDFCDMLEQASPGAIKLLFRMLTTKKRGQSKRNSELNKVGAELVAAHMRRVGMKRGTR